MSEDRFDPNVNLRDLGKALLKRLHAQTHMTESDRDAVGYWFDAYICREYHMDLVYKCPLPNALAGRIMGELRGFALEGDPNAIATLCGLDARHTRDAYTWSQREQTAKLNADLEAIVKRCDEVTKKFDTREGE